jgi:hypothetical protein
MLSRDREDGARDPDGMIAFRFGLFRVLESSCRRFRNMLRRRTNGGDPNASCHCNFQ